MIQLHFGVKLLKIATVGKLRIQYILYKWYTFVFVWNYVKYTDTMEGFRSQSDIAIAFGALQESFSAFQNPMYHFYIIMYFISSLYKSMKINDENF